MVLETRNGTKNWSELYAPGASGCAPSDPLLPGDLAETEEAPREEPNGKGASGGAAVGAAGMKATGDEGVVSDAVTNSDDSDNDSPP